MQFGGHLGGNMATVGQGFEWNIWAQVQLFCTETILTQACRDWSRSSTWCVSSTAVKLTLCGKLKFQVQLTFHFPWTRSRSYAYWRKYPGVWWWSVTTSRLAPLGQVFIQEFDGARLQPRGCHPLEKTFFILQGLGILKVISRWNRIQDLVFRLWDL